MTQFKLSFVVLIVSSLIAGCSAPNSLATNSTPNLIITEEITPQTPPPSTQTPAFVTTTPYPTLNPADADKTIANMMKENGNCSTPCFWGISPGWSDLNNSIMFITALENSYKQEVFIQAKNSETFYSVFFVQKEKMSMNIVLLARKKELWNMKVRVSGLYDENINNDDWLAFRPENILKTYGIPDHINLYLVAGPEGAYRYGFVLYYNQLIVDYLENNIVPSKNTTICPLADHNIQQFDFMVGKDLAHSPRGEKSIEEVSQLSTKDFYNLSTEETKTVCFNVNFDAYLK